jgi:hypothetical protein
MVVILCDWAQHVALRNYVKDFLPDHQYLINAIDFIIGHFKF